MKEGKQFAVRDVGRGLSLGNRVARSGFPRLLYAAPWSSGLRGSVPSRALRYSQAINTVSFICPGYVTSQQFGTFGSTNGVPFSGPEVWPLL